MPLPLSPLPHATSFSANRAQLLKSLTSARSAKGEAELRKAAQLFVGWFYGEMLKMMRATVRTESFGHGGSAEKYFQAMADEELGNAIATRDTYGLTDLILASLQRRAAMAKSESSLSESEPQGGSDRDPWLPGGNLSLLGL